MTYREEELRTRIDGIQRLEAKAKCPEYRRILQERRYRVERSLNSERRRAIFLVKDTECQILNKVILAMVFLGVCFLLFYFGK